MIDATTTEREIAFWENMEAIKLSAEAFTRRYRAGGINSYESQALESCKKAIKAETGEVLDVNDWTWKVPL